MEGFSHRVEAQSPLNGDCDDESLVVGVVRRPVDGRPPVGLPAAGRAASPGPARLAAGATGGDDPPPDRPKRPKPGKTAPDFALPNATGGEVALRDFAGRKVLLVFTQSGCGPCHRIMPELNRLQAAGEIQVLVVNYGELKATRTWAVEVRARFPVAVQEHYSLSRQYEVFATPFAFLIDEQGVIASKGDHQQPAAHRLHPGRRPGRNNGHADREQSGAVGGESEEVRSSSVLT